MEVGASLTLPCEASGDPDPTISWRRYEDQILQEDDEKYEGLSLENYQISTRQQNKTKQAKQNQRSIFCNNNET